MDPIQLQPMSVGDILDTAFRLYRNRLVTYLMIALVVYLPYALVMAVMRAGLDSLNAHAGATPGLGAVIALSGVAIAGTLVFVLIVYPLSTAALVQNISSTYLGQRIGAIESYRRGARRLLSLLGAQVLVALLLMAGVLLCVFPVVYFWLAFMVVPVVVVLEPTKATQSLSRSRQLMTNNFGKGFLVGLAVTLLSFAINFGAATAFRLLPIPRPLIAFLSTLSDSLALPLQTGVIVLLYYDLRIRKEGFDLQHLAQSIGTQAASA